MAKPTDLTDIAVDGYNNLIDMHLYSSPNSIAFRLGRWMDNKGMPAPRDVRMSRGYKIRANDMTFEWIGKEDFERIN